MYKKRIGNDIRVLALIRQRIEGVLSPFDMRGRDISVGLLNPRGVEMKIAEFDVTGDDGSILAFNFYGKDQRLVGVYTVVVRENDRDTGMRTVDKTASFELVSHSYQEGTDNDGVITIEALEIEMELAMGVKGDKGDKGEQGPKGDKMTYADLTEADKADLYEGGASLIRPLLDGKQDTISDLDAIRKGAKKGSTALQSESDPVYTADKPNLALKSELDGKVDKEEGKGLSSNDYTDVEKAKLSELEGNIYEVSNATFEVGYLLDRTSKALVSSASYRVSGYIDVAGGQSVIYSGARLGAAAAIIGYVAKDNTASAQILLGDTPTEQDFANEVVIIPEGINYIRACGRLTTSEGAERNTSLQTKSLLLVTKGDLAQDVAELDKVKYKMDIIAPTESEDVTLAIKSDKFTFVGNKIVASDGSFTDNASYYLYIYTFETAGTFYMSTLGSSSYGFCGVYRGGYPSAATFDSEIGRKMGSYPADWGRIGMAAGDSVVISINDTRDTRNFTISYETTLLKTPALFRNGRKIAWFGDSISELKKLPHRTGENMACDVYDCSQAGSSAVTLGTNPNYDGTSFQSLCSQIATGDFTILRDTIEAQYEAGIIDSARKAAKLANAANLEAVDFSTINDIVVFIGTNDLTQSSMTITSFKNGLSTAFSTLLNAYKNLNIYYILPAWRTDADDSRPNGLKLSDICNAIIEVCHTYHIPYFDFYNACMANTINSSYWLADGLHQTDAADVIWAEKLAKWLQSI